VTVTVYVVVLDGPAVGCAIVDELSPAVGLQEYVYGAVPPEATCPIVVLPLTQIDLSCPASAVGRGWTVTTTASVPMQPLASVTVTVYVVVLDGPAVG
jgi:hypothetical protein